MVLPSGSFGARLAGAVGEFGQLCVGIDPHAHLLEAWGLPVSAEGAERFGLAVVEAAAGQVGIVKPQVAFFEEYGSRGIQALENVIGAAREAGLLVIADAKRGDIGSTMTGYARAWLAPGSPLESDAVTISPYLGFGALEPAFELANEHGKGVFVLAVTSNPEARGLQTARFGNASVAGEITRAAATANAESGGGWGSIGVVIGATVNLAEMGVDAAELAGGTPILAPGFGAQGAEADDLDTIFQEAAPLVIASESRSVLSAGADGIRGRIIDRAARYPRSLDVDVTIDDEEK